MNTLGIALVAIMTTNKRFGEACKRIAEREPDPKTRLRLLVEELELRNERVSRSATEPEFASYVVHGSDR